MNFEDFNLNKNILRAIDDMGYTAPTPIQEQAIPIILNNLDLIGCAQTGTGKTAAFAIPMIQHLHKVQNDSKRGKKVKALVITPTRELAIQIGENFDAYSKYTNITQTTIFGGVSQVPQVQQLRKGVDIIVATPGRLLDLNNQGHIDLSQLHFLVLDEADQMLDMGFIHDIKKIIKLTPKNRQTLLFSATMPSAIRELADNFLNNPKYVSVAAVSSTAETVKQQVYFTEKKDKRKLLFHLIRNDNLSDLLVFTRTKHGADNAVKFLKKKDIKAEAIHGGKSQGARQRVLESFKNKETTVLVATDIAARGIDIDQLTYVINFDLPNIPESYVHRIGRTGRAGNTGLAISFCSRDEDAYWKDILKLTQADVEVISDHPYPWSGEAIAQEDEAKPKPENTSKKSRKSTNSKKRKKRWY